MQAQLGKPLTLRGHASAIRGMNSGDGALQIGPGNFLLCDHGMAPAAGSAFINEYTLIFDIRIPDTSSWYALFQTDTSNASDADFFITNGQFRYLKKTYPQFSLKKNQWVRVGVSVRAGGLLNIYVDGSRVVTGTAPALNETLSLDPKGVLFFADQNGEDNTLDVSQIQIYDNALDDAEMKQIGPPPDSPPMKKKSDIAEMKWVSTWPDAKNFGYVVEAKIYPEDPNTLFLTMRDGGITSMDITNPGAPVVLAHWGDKGTEGQDRLGNLLLVNAIYEGGIYLFDVSNPKLPAEWGYFDVNPYCDLKTGFRLLHAKIYSPSKYERYAILTGSGSASLVAVDISDPAAPKFLSVLPTGITDIEGIYVKGHYAFLGGFSSNKFAVVDLTDLSQMKIVNALEAPHYSEMVSEMAAERPDLLYTALWGLRGGLAVFDIRDPMKMTEVNSVTSLELPRANRVKIQGDYAFLPLEVSPGGVAMMDISDSSNLRFESSLMNIPGIDKPYTLAVKGEYLYTWGAVSRSMAIVKLIGKDTSHTRVKRADARSRNPVAISNDRSAKTLRIRIPPWMEGPLAFEIIDAHGKRIWNGNYVAANRSRGPVNLDYGSQNIPAGLFILRIQSDVNAFPRYSGVVLIP